MALVKGMVSLVGATSDEAARLGGTAGDCGGPRETVRLNRSGSIRSSVKK